jgi:MraZ protein
MQRRLLSGTYECSLDNRFRFAIPARLRDAFAGGATVSWWIDDCLAVVPALEWDDLVGRTFGDMSPFDETARDMRRFIIGSALTNDLDRQGRIALSADHRQHAAIEDGKLRLVGVGDYLEAWDPTRLAARFDKLRREGVSSHAERLANRVA